MSIIVRQQLHLTAYEEGQIDGRMRQAVLKSYSYPDMRYGYQGPLTLEEALAQEKENVQGFLRAVESDLESDPDDIAYLRGKLSCY